MAPSSYQSIELYPELESICDQFEIIRYEALAVRSAMIDIHDNRVSPGQWRVLVLLPENEDRQVSPEDIWMANRRLVPETTKILTAVPSLEAYTLSTLEPNGHIRPHRHKNAFVTAALCLQNGGDSCIVVDGKRHDYHDGEVIIFDYTLEHEVFNFGAKERIVLLMLFDNRLVI